MLREITPNPPNTKANVASKLLLPLALAEKAKAKRPTRIPSHPILQAALETAGLANFASVASLGELTGFLTGVSVSTVSQFS
jgi:hypothetical protein